MKIYTRCFALSLLIFSSALCHAALQNGKIQVAVIKGQTSLINPQSIKEPISTGKLFEQGYKVETSKESSVELCLSNGSTILVNPETLVEIRTFRQVASSLIVDGAYQKLDKEPSPSVVEVFVVKGKIIGEVRKLNPQSSFTIKSPAGVARIRGTVYSVEYSEDKSRRVGNMEVACVKGSVELTVNGSNSGPTPVAPGKKVNAQAPIDEPETKRSVPAVPIKISPVAPVENSKEVTLPTTEGIVVGAEIKTSEISGGVKVVSVKEGKVELSAPVTMSTDTVIVFDPPAGATFTPNADDDKLKKSVLLEDVLSKSVLKLENSDTLKVGMKIKAPGLAEEVEVIAVNPVTHEVTLSSPVSLKAGVEVAPANDSPAMPIITTPVITVSKLEPTEISKISQNLASGTGLPPKLTDDIQKIADNTPPTPPPAPKKETETKEGDKSTESGDTKTDTTKETTTETNNPPTNTGGGTTNTGGINDVTEAINKTIQETIEKENQKNPSPTQ